MDLPKYLEGVVTLEEFQSFIKFQQEANDDPGSKELLGKIIELRKQLQQLQGEMAKRHAQALANHPEMRAIALKMQQAMFAHSPMAPGPTPPGFAPMHPPAMPAAAPPAAKP
jgi:hypothetical protein